jgi:hypothetical protein
MEEFNYENYVDEAVTLGGFKQDELTDDQKHAVLVPSEAPEDYYCDGEVSEREALSNWIYRLKRTGLTAGQIKKARKMNGV